jgi:hypothetical protein
MKAAALADAILRDRGQRRDAAEPRPDMECFGCGKQFVYRGPRGDDSGRFCSDVCRIEYDIPRAFTFDAFKVTRWRVVAGGDPGYLVAIPMTRMSARKCADGEYRGGFRLNCRGCGKPFEGLGWAYCSNDCKRTCRDHKANDADMAEAEMERPTKRKCQECGGNIPRWRKGRLVSKVTKFCSDKCAARARRKAKTSRDSPDGVLSPETAKKCRKNGPRKPVLIGPNDLPINRLR